MSQSTQPIFIESPQYFGPYAARLTTEDDVEGIIKHIQDKEKAPDASKREAVYLRDAGLIAKQVSRGFFVVLERIAANDRERTALGAERGIVAATGAYPLGLDATNTQVRIPIKAYNGVRSPALMTWEIGSSLYVKENDLPNERGLKPKGCTYDLIVGLTTFNLFRLAATETVEAITANVQSHLGDVIERLTGEYLRWSIIGKPSPQLENGSLSTTVDREGSGNDRNFGHSKQFYQVTPDKLPTMAKFLYRAYRDSGVSYDRGSVTNILEVDFSQLPVELVALIEATTKRPDLFDNKKEAGFADVRRQLEPFLPPEKELEAVASAARGFVIPVDVVVGRDVTHVRRHHLAELQPSVPHGLFSSNARIHRHARRATP